MLVSRIELSDPENLISIHDALSELPINQIASVNWVSQFPEKPTVSFKIAHNGTHLFLQYFVQEREVLAKTESDNGKVWTDSCVEFFISFADSPYYYNAEFSCIGKALLGYRKDRNDSIYGDPETMNLIKRYPSLGTEVFDSRSGDIDWNMVIVIPVTAFWMTDMLRFDGLQARANFYKCGDGLQNPHYLSWNPIASEKPNFHLTKFFGILNFQS